MDWSSLEAYFSVIETKSGMTADHMVRYLRRAQAKLDFDVDRFEQSPEDAMAEGTKLLAKLRALRSPHPFNHMVRSLNGLARYRVHQGFPEFDRIRWTMLPEPKPPSKVYRDWELHKIMAYVADGKGRAQNERTRRRKALAWVGHFTAMRRGEVHRARDQDFHVEDLEYVVRDPSKRGPPRTLPVEPEFYSPHRAFLAWLRWPLRPIAKEDPHAVWTKTTKDGRVVVLSYAEIGNELDRMSRGLGFRVNFNRSRHQRAREMMLAGIPLPLIRDVLGHASIETTARYAETLPDDLRRELRRRKPRSPTQRPKDENAPPPTEKREEDDDEREC